MWGDGCSIMLRRSTEQMCPWRVCPNWGRWQGQLWHHMSHVRRERCHCLLTGGRICSTLAREMWRGCSAKMQHRESGSVPLSRAFLSLGISSELPLFCSVIPTPQVQVAAGPVPAWQRGERARPWGRRVSDRFLTSVGLQRSVSCPSVAHKGWWKKSLKKVL